MVRLVTAGLFLDAPAAAVLGLTLVVSSPVSSRGFICMILRDRVGGGGSGELVLRLGLGLGPGQPTTAGGT